VRIGQRDREVGVSEVISKYLSFTSCIIEANRGLLAYRRKWWYGDCCERRGQVCSTNFDMRRGDQGKV